MERQLTFLSRSPRVLSVVIGLDLDAYLLLIRGASEGLGVKGEGIGRGLNSKPVAFLAPVAVLFIPKKLLTIQ